MKDDDDDGRGRSGGHHIITTATSYNTTAFRITFYSRSLITIFFLALLNLADVLLFERENMYGHGR